MFTKCKICCVDYEVRQCQRKTGFINTQEAEDVAKWSEKIGKNLYDREDLLWEKLSCSVSHLDGNLQCETREFSGAYGRFDF